MREGVQGARRSAASGKSYAQAEPHTALDMRLVKTSQRTLLFTAWQGCGALKGGPRHALLQLAL
jgi:hypothetical protein